LKLLRNEMVNRVAGARLYGLSSLQSGTVWQSLKRVLERLDFRVIMTDWRADRDWEAPTEAILLLYRRKCAGLHLIGTQIDQGAAATARIS
jgi:hypothetical protein